MSKRVLSLVLCVFALLVGCGKFDKLEDGGFTTVKFNRGVEGDFTAKSTLVGGVLIYAFSENYSTNLVLSDETGSANIVLPNGAYSFYAFGYDSNTSVMVGNTRCAIVGNPVPVPLTGQTATVSLNLMQSTCTAGSFNGGGSYSDGTQIRDLQVVMCGSSAGTTLSTFSGSSDCSSHMWGNAPRLKVRVPKYRLDRGQYIPMGNAYESTCLMVSTSGTYMGQSIRFPVGLSPQNGFAIEFDTYGNGDFSCTSAPIAQHQFRRGLFFGPTPTNSSLGSIAPAGPFSTRLFLREP